MKIQYFAFILLVLAGLLAGCAVGSGTVKNGEEFNTPTKMSMIYDKFDGYKQGRIDVNANEPVEVKVNIVTEGGSIAAYIAKDNEISHSSYEGHNIPTSSFTVTLTEPGNYTVRVDADNHTGGYSFSWGK